MFNLAATWAPVVIDLTATSRLLVFGGCDSALLVCKTILTRGLSVRIALFPLPFAPTLTHSATAC